jgi:long-chain acyl-CoA synthetase
MESFKRQNILSLLEEKTNKYAESVALGIKTNLGWKEFTYHGIGMLSRKLANYMIHNLELKKGEKMALLCESRPEFGTCVFASILAGLVTVPLDIKLTKYELLSILSDCEPAIIIVSQQFMQTALELQKELTSIKHILVVDETSSCEALSIHQLPNNYEGKWRHRSSKSTALIIYTSGTTGKPKGVMISFQNMMAQMSDLDIALRTIIGKENAKILSILPMNHLFELTVGFAAFMNFGYSVYYTQSLNPKDILSIMRDKQIEFMIVVPAFLKLLRTSIENEIQKSGKGTQFKFAYNLAKFLPSYRVKKMLFAKIHKKFGGKFEVCLSGGAPLDVEVGKFFERIGVRVYQGYGLSEASPVVSVNFTKRKELASVGPPLKSLEVKLDPDTGELLVRGPSVMKGYHNQPELTAEVIDEDGWLHTGDVATIDEDGHIFITGRIKNMIVLSGGKKVLPEEVESVLEKSELVAELCVLGVEHSKGAKDGTEEVAAVVVPHERLWNENDEKSVEKMVRADIKELSKQLSSYKRPSNIIIKKEPLPRTSTRKIKRKEVYQLIKEENK